MKFLLDENLGTEIQGFIVGRGHECDRASAVLGRGVSDSAVYQYCLSNTVHLITRDHHFLNAFRFPVREYFGIIFIRHGNLRASDEIALLSHFFTSIDLNQLCGRLHVISRSGIAIFPGNDS